MTRARCSFRGSQQYDSPLTQVLLILDCKCLSYTRQADHLLDLKDVRTVEKDLKAKLSVNAVNLKKMLDKALTVEIYVNNFTAKLTQIIEENEQGKWPDLTKELYDTYVNDTHRQMNTDCLSEKTEMKHQRY